MIVWYDKSLDTCRVSEWDPNCGWPPSAQDWLIDWLWETPIAMTPLGVNDETRVVSGGVSRCPRMGMPDLHV